MNHVSNLFIRIIFCLIVILPVGFCISQTIEKIDFVSEGKQVVITYNLVNCKPKENYEVSLVFVDQTTQQQISPRKLKGNIRNKTCGSKRIVWDISKDIKSLSGTFYPEIALNAYPKGPVDINGYEYDIVKIGSQEWFTENLRTTKFNDGTNIQYVPNEIDWQYLSTNGWCYYQNDSSKNDLYGKLYNWYTLNPVANGNKNICPIGWHVPSDDEWEVLITYLGGKYNAGKKMIRNDNNIWGVFNSTEINSSVFSALPNGYRGYDGIYYDGEAGAYWWSSTQSDSENAWYRNITNENFKVNNFDGSKNDGIAIRCLKD